jgi:hypothetical protein
VTNPYRCVEYGEATCGAVAIPSAYLAGVEGADIVLFITGATTQGFSFHSLHYIVNGLGNTVAFAQQCQFDQFDRPISGRVNIGPPKLAKDFT